MKKVISLLTFVFLLVNTGCATVKGEEKKMAQLLKEDVVKIANKEAMFLGYDVMSMKINIDCNNTAWNNYNKNNIVLQHNAEIKEKLQNKKYWAVYYAPKELQLGGDLWVFVEKENGKIITFIKGE